MKMEKFITVLLPTTATCVWILIILISKFRDWFVYIIPIFRIFVTTGVLIGRFKSSPNEEGPKQIITMLTEEFFLDFCFFWDIFLLSPSMKVTTFVYTPIFFISYLVHKFNRLDIRQDDNLTFSLLYALSISAVGNLVYYFMQIKELQHFFEKLESEQSF